ncbi:MAG: hypothetical protein ACI4R9_09130 [Kiritimatiellia bacterium]
MVDFEREFGRSAYVGAALRGLVPGGIVSIFFVDLFRHLLRWTGHWRQEYAHETPGRG